MSREEEVHLKSPDRSQAPSIHAIERMELKKPAKHTLSNGLPLYELHGGTEDVVKLQLLFQAGTKYQDRPGLAAATNELIKEGTERRSAQEINELVEHYGVSLSSKVDRDHASLGFYVLSRHLEPVLSILQEILEGAIFPEEELEHYIDQQKDELLEEREKVSYLARQRFLPVIFGEEHPYGRTIENPEILDRIDRESVRRFYREHYFEKGGVSLFFSGKTDETLIRAIDEKLGGLPLQPESSDSFTVGPPQPSTDPEHFVHKEGALQAALRIGKPLFGRDHPDHHGVMVLTALLGGYFGSRLMMNIREDKGYTYGIGAALIPLQESGFFTIATEVGSQVKDDALKEIRKELELLQMEQVSDEELEHVRRFMQGSFLRAADGPFAMMELFKKVHKAGLDLDHYDRLMETVNSITPERLQELARTHLRPEDMRTVVAGSGG